MNARHTGGEDFDQQPGDDGLSVLIEPRTRDGRSWPERARCPWSCWTRPSRCGGAGRPLGLRRRGRGQAVAPWPAGTRPAVPPALAGRPAPARAAALVRPLRDSGWAAAGSTAGDHRPAGSAGTRVPPQRAVSAAAPVAATAPPRSLPTPTTVRAAEESSATLPDRAAATTATAPPGPLPRPPPAASGSLRGSDRLRRSSRRRRRGTNPRHCPAYRRFFVVARLRPSASDRWLQNRAALAHGICSTGRSGPLKCDGFTTASAVYWSCVTSQVSMRNESAQTLWTGALSGSPRRLPISNQPAGMTTSFAPSFVVMVSGGGRASAFWPEADGQGHQDEEQAGTALAQNERQEKTPCCGFHSLLPVLDPRLRRSRFSMLPADAN